MINMHNIFLDIIQTTAMIALSVSVIGIGIAEVVVKKQRKKIK
jgi:hypothetical protein